MISFMEIPVQRIEDSVLIQAQGHNNISDSS